MTLIDPSADLRPITVIIFNLNNGNGVAFKVFGTSEEVTARLDEAVVKRDTFVRFASPGESDRDTPSYLNLSTHGLVNLTILPDRDLTQRIVRPQITH